MKDQRSTRKNGHYASGEVSVTTVLGVLNKPALTMWLQKQIFNATLDGAQTFAQANKVVKEISKKAMDSGTRVHKYVEDYGTGKELKLDEDLMDYYKAFNEWVIDYKPEFIAREFTVTSKKYGYKGTVDMLAKINGKGCLIDFKTGKSIYETVELQASAYKQAYEEQGRGKIDELWCLLLEKGDDGMSTGKYQFKKLNYRPEIFNALVKVYNWTNAK